MIAADVSYINADAEVALEYDSKNIVLSGTDAPAGEIVTALESAALAVTINISDLAYASDLRWDTYSGLLNGAPFNLHAILEDSSLDPPVDDVTIYIGGAAA